MTISIDDYPLTATSSLKGAVNVAIQRLLEGLTFERANGDQFRFERVLDDWADYDERYTGPAAVVDPAPTEWDEIAFGPRLDESTWFPQGLDGFGLYCIASAEAEVGATIRAAYKVDRDAIFRGLETAFVSSGIGLGDLGEIRYGVSLDMPEYYGRTLQVSLLGVDDMDSEGEAIKNQWWGRIRLATWTEVVVLQPVKLLKFVSRELDVTIAPIPEPGGGASRGISRQNLRQAKGFASAPSQRLGGASSGVAPSTSPGGQIAALAPALGALVPHGREAPSLALGGRSSAAAVVAASGGVSSGESDPLPGGSVGGGASSGGAVLAAAANLGGVTRAGFLPSEEALGGISSGGAESGASGSPIVEPAPIVTVTEISGAANIEDTYLNGFPTSQQPDRNYGASALLNVSWQFIRGALIRLNSAAIPAGTVTAATFTWKSSHTPSVGANDYTLRFLRVKDANAAWVEGTVNGLIEVGSPCYNWLAYNTVAWAGGAGMNLLSALAVANPDWFSIVEEPSSPTQAILGVDNTLTEYSVAIPPAWIEHWRDVSAAGMLIRYEAADATNNTTIVSSSDVTNGPKFTITTET